MPVGIRKLCTIFNNGTKFVIMFIIINLVKRIALNRYNSYMQDVPVKRKRADPVKRKFICHKLRLSDANLSLKVNA